MNLYLIKQIFLNHRIHWVTEGASHSIKHETKSTSFNERQSLDCVAQKQGIGGSRLANHLVSSLFVRNIHERLNKDIEINDHERSKSRTYKFVNMEILLYVDCTVTVLLHILCDSPIILRQTE